MRRSTLILALGAITALNFLMLRQRGPAVEASVPPPARADIVAAGPGLVEPVSEELHVSAQVGGRLERVTAADGDRVRAGEVLAVIENGEYAARVKVVDRVVDAASGTFGVRLELPNPQGAVPAGVKCKVRFE